MKYILAGIVAWFVMLSAATQKTADFAGTWKLSFEIFGSPMSETCTLHAEGKALKGTCVMEGNQMEAAGKADIVGELNGKDIQFRHAAELLGNPVPLNFSGIVADDESFSGTLGIDAFNMNAPFTAIKAGAAEQPR